MKNLFVLLFALFFSFGLFAQTKSYEVKGHIKDLNADRGFMHQDDGEEAEYTPITIDGENFYYKGECSFPVMVSITHTDRRVVSMGKLLSLYVIASPGATITTKGKISNFNEVYSKSDAENKALTRIHKKVLPLQGKAAALSSKIRRDESLTEAQKSELKAEADELSAKSLDVLKSMIRKNPSSVAALWYLNDMLIRSQIDPEEVGEIIARVDSKYYDHPYYLTVKTKVAGAKASAVGQIVPDVVSNLTPDGNTFDLKSLRGKFVVIDFWGTWCGPCMEGMPKLRELRDKYNDKLQIVGIASDQKARWKAEVEKTEVMNWPHILSGKGDLDYIAKFNVAGYPTKLIVGPDGKILYRSVGESEEFYAKLEQYLKR